MGETTITANDDISFSIEKGELVIILGPSGAGKSTILNILGGMDTPDEGRSLLMTQILRNFQINSLLLTDEQM